MCLPSNETLHSTFKAYLYILAADCSRAPVRPKTVLYKGQLIFRQPLAAEKCDFCYGGGIGIDHEIDSQGKLI